MIELRTLGRLDLRQDGTEARAVLRQPKRLAFLAYLAIASPRRFHRRDALLALFWAELDQAHARAALRRALYFLRKALGEGVIAGRGDEELSAPEEAVWCDVAAFERALAAGKLEEALELYHGDLLEGFFVSQAPEFERWLDLERTRLRDRAAAAARSLTDRAEAAGSLDQATRWAQRLTSLSPFDENAFRRYATLLDHVGDRASSLRAYEEFSALLRQAYEIDPAPETRSLIDTIRARPAPSAPRARRSAPAAQPSASSQRIAILPFTIRGRPEFDYLREGMVDLLSTKLDGAGDFRTVDPRAILSAQPRGATTVTDPDAARAIAERFEAGLFLLGSVVEVGGRIQISATLCPTGDAEPVSAQTRSGAETEIFELVDELARQLLAGRAAGAGARVTRLAALTTESLEGLKAWLAGERDFRLGRYFEAMDAFQRAVSHDDGFALAYYRLAAATAASAMPDIAREAAASADHHRARLGPHDRLLLDAQRAWLAGSAAQAEGLYSVIVSNFPDDMEAWFLLGDLQFHSNPLRGRSVVEARHPFERALALDPEHVTSMVHLVRIAALQGNHEERDRRIARILELSPQGDRAIAMRALHAFAHRDPVAKARVVAQLKQSRALTVAIASADVALYSGDLAGAEELGLAFLEVARSDDLRALCHIVLAHFRGAMGRWREARESLVEAERLEPAWGLEVRALFAALPFVPWPRDEVAAVRDTLEQWDAAATAPSMNLAFAAHNDLHPHLRLYLLGLLGARLGDLDRARAAAEALRGLTRAQTHATFVANLELSLASAIARAEGDPVHALAALEATGAGIWFQLTVASPFFSQAFDRYHRGLLLRQAGRNEEAGRWLRSIAERSPYELIYRSAANS